MDGMTMAMTAFFIALAGLVGLFALKHHESVRGRMVLPGTRRKADEYALEAKAFILVLLREIGELPPLLLVLAQLGIRQSAITFARFAHWLAQRAHALADVASHKHRFERRETNSEFLKQVIEHPMKPVNGRTNGVHPPSYASTLPNLRDEPKLALEPDPAPMSAPLPEPARKNSRPSRPRKKKTNVLPEPASLAEQE